MALATIGTIATIAASAASLASLGFQASQGTPKVPNGASASRAIAEAQADMLPIQRQIAAAAQQGQSVTVNLPAHTTTQKMVLVPGGTESTHGGPGDLLGLGPNSPDPISGAFAGKSFDWVPYVPSEWAEGGKYFDLGQKKSANGRELKFKDREVKVEAGPKTYDFSGYGTADIEGQMAKAMTDVQLAIGQKYGVQFAEESRKLAELADPEGTKARALENELIQKQISNPKPISPLSGMIDKQVGDQLKAGAGVDSMSRELLDKAVAKANASRGGSTSAGDVSNSMSTGYEGEGRRQAAYDKSQSWLSSGQTPEDLDYRREQQNISDLGAFVNGQTPEAQFGAVKSAGSGASPVYPGQQLPQQPGGQAAQGEQFAVNSYQQTTQQQASQANPWMGGLSALLQGIGTLNTARR